MIQNIMKNWNLMRILRLAMGILLVVEAARSGMWLLVAVGAIFVAMPVLNIGCCASGNCAVQPKKFRADEETEYQELK